MSNHFNETSQRFFENSDINYRSAWVYFPKIQKFKTIPFSRSLLGWDFPKNITTYIHLALRFLGHEIAMKAIHQKKINLKLPWYCGSTQREMLCGFFMIFLWRGWTSDSNHLIYAGLAVLWPLGTCSYHLGSLGVGGNWKLIWEIQSGLCWKCLGWIT